MTWPPPYTIRKSKRAKRLHLKVSRRGIEIVLPYRCPKYEAIDLLNKHRSWVETQLNKFSSHVTVIEPPLSLNLAALQQSWQIYYYFDEGPARLRTQANYTLLIAGNYLEKDRWQLLLKAWLRKQAQHILPAWLTTISKEVNLPFNKVSVRAQKTRWGSCSSHKDISLNYKLLFLNPDLVRHILLHELAHTVHMNHSKSFWKLLNQLDPKTPTLEPKSQHTLTQIPGWLEN